MSEPLQRSAGSIGTISNITKHAPEIERLIGIIPAAPSIAATNPEIEDPTAFAIEKHLEDFLVHNWQQAELGRDWDMFVEDGEIVGQQYETDTGPIDILAISKDKMRLLVVELKKGRASDAVVGQVLRYMGYVQEELAEDGQTVWGAIITLEDDQRLRRALAAVPSVAFYRYIVDYKDLLKRVENAIAVYSSELDGRRKAKIHRFCSKSGLRRVGSDLMPRSKPFGCSANLCRHPRANWSTSSTSAGIHRSQTTCRSIHELAHLLDPTHGKKVVSILDRALPDWRVTRDLLKRLSTRYELSEQLAS